MNNIKIWKDIVLCNLLVFERKHLGEYPDKASFVFDVKQRGDFLDSKNHLLEIESAIQELKDLGYVSGVGGVGNLSREAKIIAIDLVDNDKCHGKSQGVKPFQHARTIASIPPKKKRPPPRSTF